MHRQALAGFLTLAMAACSSESLRTPAQPETVVLPLRVDSMDHAPAPIRSEAAHVGTPENHRTHLSGDQEPFVPATPDSPTPADSHAQGQAIFQISKDGLSFDYKLIVSNIENVTQAHIHCGAAGTNGPIIVWLYPGPTATTARPPGAGRHDGVLAQDSIVSGTPQHVRTVPDSAACPGGVATFAAVIQKMRTGQAYVNVHTSDGVAPPNTGPGDFPNGEVRGQL